MGDFTLVKLSLNRTFAVNSTIWVHSKNTISELVTDFTRVKTCQTEKFIFIFRAGIHKFVGDLTRVKSPTKLVKANFN